MLAHEKHKAHIVMLVILIVCACFWVDIFINRRDLAAISSYKEITIEDFVTMGCLPYVGEENAAFTIYEASFDGGNFQLVSVQRDLRLDYAAIFRVGPLPGLYYRCS